MTTDMIIMLIGGALLGVIGAPTFFQWVKSAFHAKDAVAFVVTYATCFVIATVALFVSGQLNIAALTWSNVFVVANMILGAASFVYKVLMGSPDQAKG